MIYGDVFRFLFQRFYFKLCHKDIESLIDRGKMHRMLECIYINKKELTTTVMQSKCTRGFKSKIEPR